MPIIVLSILPWFAERALSVAVESKLSMIDSLIALGILTVLIWEISLVKLVLTSEILLRNSWFDSSDDCSTFLIAEYTPPEVIKLSLPSVGVFSIELIITGIRDNTVLNSSSDPVYPANLAVSYAEHPSVEYRGSHFCVSSLKYFFEYVVMSIIF